MKRSDESSLNRQRERRKLRQSAENVIDAIDEQIDKYEDYQSSGRMDSTSGKFGSRAVKAEIDRLEGEKQKVEDQLAQGLEEDRQRGGAGQDASTGSRSGMPSMDQREAAAGLFNTTPGRGLDDPTMEEREIDAGLTGRDKNTTGMVPSPVPTGRDFSDETQGQTTGEDGELPDEKDNDDPLGTFGVIVVINNNAHGASVYGQLQEKISQEL